MSCMQGESDRETLCSQTSRNWKRCTHLKLMQKDSTRRKWLRPKLVISICDWEKRKTTWRRSGSENIHLDKGQRRTRRSAWRPSRRVRRFPPPTRQDSTHGDGEVRNDFLSNTESYIYRHHVEPRVKLHVQREEIVRIPLRYLDVSRTTNTDLDVLLKRRADDHWNIDGTENYLMHGQDLHGLPSWTKDLQTNIPGPGDAFYKKTSNIHVRSLVSRNKDKYVRRCSTMRKAKVGHRKTETRQCVKTTRSLLRWPGRHRVESWKFRWKQLCPCKIRKSQHRETCCYTDNRKSKTCMHRGSRRIHKKAFGRNPA